MSYADHPLQMSGVVFPNRAMQTLSSVIHLTGCSVLASCFARRSSCFLRRGSLATMSWPRWCILLDFAASWLFLFATGILVGGTGMSTSFASCALGVYACITLYAFSKIMIYWFLIEKVHIVWGGNSRIQSKVYWLCFITMLPYVAIAVMMFLGRVAYFHEDRECVIGLRRYASLSLLVYDLYINVFLTGMFLWPLFRSRLTNPKIRNMALRTLVAACVALTTSTVNIAVLTLMHGQQLGWVCLGSCGSDVTINALALFWVTSYGSSSDNMASEKGEPALEVPPADDNRSPEAGPRPTSLVVARVGPESPARFITRYSDLVCDHMPWISAAVRSTLGGARTSGGAQDSVVYKEKDQTKSNGSKGGGVLNMIGDAFRGRNDSGGDDHHVSIQVTITTEHQKHVTTDNAKRASTSLSISDSAKTCYEDDNICAVSAA